MVPEQVKCHEEGCLAPERVTPKMEVLQPLGWNRNVVRNCKDGFHALHQGATLPTKEDSLLVADSLSRPL